MPIGETPIKTEEQKEKPIDKSTQSLMHNIEVMHKENLHPIEKISEIETEAEDFVMGLFDPVVTKYFKNADNLTREIGSGSFTSDLTKEKERLLNTYEDLGKRMEGRKNAIIKSLRDVFRFSSEFNEMLPVINDYILWIAEGKSKNKTEEAKYNSLETYYKVLVRYLGSIEKQLKSFDEKIKDFDKFLKESEEYQANLRQLNAQIRILHNIFVNVKESLEKNVTFALSQYKRQIKKAA